MKYLFMCYYLITAIGVFGFGKNTKKEMDEILTRESTYYGIPCISFDTKNVLNPDKVMELYKKMQQEGKEQRYVPLIINDEGRNKEAIEWTIKKFSSYKAMTAHYLDAYKNININQYFSKLKKEYEKNNLFDFSWVDDLIQNSPYPDMDLNEFTEVTKQEELSLGSMSSDIFILKVPVTKPYEVLAYFPMGGFNSCPSTEELMAIAKYWYESYGAVPCAADIDTLQFYLDKPIKTEKQAKKAADESYMVCFDSVAQGAYTLDNLKESIKGSNFWFFWWD